MGDNRKKYEKPKLIDLMTPEWEVGSGQGLGKCFAGGSARGDCGYGGQAASGNYCGNGDNDTSDCNSGTKFKP